MTKDNSDYYILVIEDNPGDILLIREYLSEQIENPHITVVNNFSKVRNILETNHQFDIILLDLSLPDKFGTELINEVLEMGKGIPVIILTDFPDMDFSIKSISY
jgi:CheY-like chemotaxis protein